MKKLLSILLALVMILSLATTAFAQTVDSENGGSAKITIENASKGETYELFKLFGATINEDADSIAYTGTVPTELATYFVADANGYISATNAAKKAGTDGTLSDNELSEAAVDALKAWADAQTTPTASAISEGGALEFTNLEYGYYVVTTTQNNGLAITVDSTKPNATIYDKNTTVPKELTKDVAPENVYIGETVTYTVKFKTANYSGTKKIISYTIGDTLPDFLSNENVTGITVDGTAIATQQFNSNNKIVLNWVGDDGNHLYANGAEVVITYTAVVTDSAAIDGEGNTNKVTVTWECEGTEQDPGKLEDTATIYTYALALKKVDQKGNPLADATFQFPFYVKETPAADGAYIYAGTAEGDGLINTIITPDDGLIIVKGLKSGEKVTITETAAPAGYNKLTKPVEVTPTKTGSTTTNVTVYLDENGNVTETATNTIVNVISDKIAAKVVVVVNMTGTELPETGGMGTTLIYTLGAILAVGSLILLVVKKRMAAAE